MKMDVNEWSFSLTLGLDGNHNFMLDLKYFMTFSLPLAFTTLFGSVMKKILKFSFLLLTFE
jgi:hypothetical protein